MTPEARVAAAIGILDTILDGAPAERALTHWARQNRYAGSGDRAALRDIVFDALRRCRSYAWSGRANTGRGLMIGRLHNLDLDPAATFTGTGYAPPALSDGEGEKHPLDDAPDPVKYDCPDWLWPKLKTSLGADTAPVLNCFKPARRFFCAPTPAAQIARGSSQALQAKA